MLSVAKVKIFDVRLSLTAILVIWLMLLGWLRVMFTRSFDFFSLSSKLQEHCDCTKEKGSTPSILLCFFCDEEADSQVDHPFHAYNWYACYQLYCTTIGWMSSRANILSKDVHHSKLPNISITFMWHQASCCDFYYRICNIAQCSHCWLEVKQLGVIGNRIRIGI